MSYVLLIYPRTDPLVGRIRRTYDPTAAVVEPHIAVVYPLPESVGRDRLIAHVVAVTGGCAPFDIRLGGFHTSPDHWLSLTLAQGGEDVRRLHRLLHTGPLAEFRDMGREFVPRLGLGHFLKKGAIYDWENPREEDFDAQRYEAALRVARPLLAGPSERIDTLHLATVPDEVLEWSSGARSTLPRGLRVADVRTFQLGARHWRPEERSVQIRAATEVDASFLVSLACQAYRDVVACQFGSWNEAEQAARFADKLARLPFEVGRLAGRPIAAVSSSVHADHVFLHELLVLPEFQNRGFGSYLLEREIRRAQRRGLPLRLHTLRESRAVRLFERHGFIVTARGDVYVDLERAGPKGA